MTQTPSARLWELSAWLIVAQAAMLVGCRTANRNEPVSIANPTLGSLTIAVAPALNLSGSADFDPDRFADLMASELSYAEGVSVIPVSRVLGVLASQGRTEVESPTHAYELAGLLGADGILVFAVTEYEPYSPPRIGISAQLYSVRSRSGRSTVDPVALSRRVRFSSVDVAASSTGVLAQTQRVFDAAHRSVIDKIRAFGRQRVADDSPYGWRKYVVSQQHFIRYCCYATIRALLNGEGEVELANVERER